MHLGAPYFNDEKSAEKRVVAFLDSIKDNAEAIFLLGDVLDYWYEYKYVVPRGFVRFFGKLAELSDAGIRIVWLIGNHDIWIFDYLPTELGIEVIDGEIVEDLYGKKVFMAHGDGVGRQSTDFTFIRSLFRNKVCQWFYGAIHPRWTVPFAYRWSGHSRMGGKTKSIKNEAGLISLRDFAVEYHRDHPAIDYFIFGHIHKFCRERIAENCEMIVLGEWINTFSYAKMSYNGLELLKWHD